MSLQRFRSAFEMPRPPRVVGDELVRAIAAAWERAHLRGVVEIPLGVHKYKSLADAQVDREQLIRQRLQRLSNDR